MDTVPFYTVSLRRCTRPASKRSISQGLGGRGGGTLSSKGGVATLSCTYMLSLMLRNPLKRPSALFLASLSVIKKLVRTHACGDNMLDMPEKGNTPLHSFKRPPSFSKSRWIREGNSLHKPSTFSLAFTSTQQRRSRALNLACMASAPILLEECVHPDRRAWRAHPF